MTTGKLRFQVKWVLPVRQLEHKGSLLHGLQSKQVTPRRRPMCLRAWRHIELAAGQPVRLELPSKLRSLVMPGNQALASLRSNSSSPHLSSQDHHIRYTHPTRLIISVLLRQHQHLKPKRQIYSHHHLSSSSHRSHQQAQHPQSLQIPKRMLSSTPSPKLSPRPSARRPRSPTQQHNPSYRKLALFKTQWQPSRARSPR